jgi:hypothetical protein
MLVSPFALVTLFLHTAVLHQHGGTVLFRYEFWDTVWPG